MSSSRIYDFGTLCAVIAEWINRSDLSLSIPDFIRNVETTLDRSMRVHQQLTVVQAAVPAQTNWLELPGDFLEAYNVRFAGSPFISMGNFTANTIDGSIQNNQYDIPNVNVPKAFTFTARHVEFNPTPVVANTLELWYYAALPPLDDTNTTNWLLQQHPDIYLYGALAESLPYLNNDDRIATMAGRFSSAVNSLVDASKKRKLSGGPLNYRPKVIL